MQPSAMASAGTVTSRGAERARSLDRRGLADAGGQPELSLTARAMGSC